MDRPVVRGDTPTLRALRGPTPQLGNQQSLSPPDQNGRLVLLLAVAIRHGHDRAGIRRRRVVNGMLPVPRHCLRPGVVVPRRGASRNSVGDPSLLDTRLALPRSGGRSR